MQRLRFQPGDQRKFLNVVLLHSGLKPRQVAQFLNVSNRTFYDWRREKYTISLEASQRLSERYGIILPRNTTILDRYWYVAKGSILGAFAAHEKHGPMIGGSMYRKKQWQSWYHNGGKEKLIRKNTIKRPRISRKLAEFVGILLGDGGITTNQVVITLDATTDHEYICYVTRLVEELFRIVPKIYPSKRSRVVDICVSSTLFVEYCHTKLGLPIGNKLRQGISVPQWVMNHGEYQRWCVCGLMDTDGCIFYERHRTSGKIYSYPRLSIVSMSPALREQVRQIFHNLKFCAIIRSNRSVQLESNQAVKRYFTEIGTSNQKHLNRYRSG